MLTTMGIITVLALGIAALKFLVKPRGFIECPHGISPEDCPYCQH